MHPKCLKTLCVDELVVATVQYQLSAPTVEKLWCAVSQVWGHLWQLGSGLAIRAISLLHSHLLCQPLLDATIPGHREVHDATPTLVTLLATRTRILSLVPVKPQLSKLSPAIATLVCPKDLPLQELVLTGIDMGSELDFLVCLLRCCKRLSVLKLGGNCSAAVLEAARECPLTVLHVSERMAWQPRIQKESLASILIGCEESLQQVLGTICQGKQPNFKPSWPDITDICTGWCRVSSEFLLLVLVAFPRLQHLRSQLIDTSVVVRRFADLARQVPSLHNLSLTNIVICENFSKMHRYFPNATTLHVFNITNMERLLWELLEASCDLPHLHVLKLTLGPGSARQQGEFPPQEQFFPFGRRITELHIEEIDDGGWVFALLRLFPAVQHLHITTNALYIPENRHHVAVYPSVSKLECICHNSAYLLLFLGATFPSLESLTLWSHCGRLALPWEQLAEMDWLRDVRLLGNFVDNISGLCCVPRDSCNSSYWRLCVRPGSVTPDDLAMLRWCGWTCFYVKD